MCNLLWKSFVSKWKVCWKLNYYTAEYALHSPRVAPADMCTLSPAPGGVSPPCKASFSCLLGPVHTVRLATTIRFLLIMGYTRFVNVAAVT